MSGFKLSGEREYEEALARMEELADARPGSVEEQEYLRLCEQIEAYEAEEHSWMRQPPTCGSGCDSWKDMWRGRSRG